MTYIHAFLRDISLYVSAGSTDNHRTLKHTFLSTCYIYEPTRSVIQQNTKNEIYILGFDHLIF